MSHFFAYLARMKNIRRWGLMRNTQSENNLEHSMMCCYIAHGLAVIGNAYFGRSYDPGRIMEAAAYHDAAEVITGDLATPIKYFNPGIQEAYRTVEAMAEEKLMDMLPLELRPTYQSLFRMDEETRTVVKAADKLCAYIKCLEEGKAGNQEFQKAKENIERALLENPLPEVRYFMEHFLESFSLTLDELN
jgi:5'-deoxynucleotidase